MTFSQDLKKFELKTERLTLETFTEFVDLAHDSIQNGSPITGAPGQQVDEGGLIASWQKWYETRTRAMIATNKKYAIQEEEGITASGTPIVQHSQVGGPHSTKLTIAGAPRLAEEAARRVTGGRP